jgi:hypothetical protein
MQITEASQMSMQQRNRKPHQYKWKHNPVGQAGKTLGLLRCGQGLLQVRLLLSLFAGQLHIMHITLHFCCTKKDDQLEQPEI